MTDTIEKKNLGKWMTIEKHPPSYGRKTPQYVIRNKSSGDILGVISWYSAWRQYCFSPREDCVFSAGCLQDIVRAINEARL